MTAWKVCLHVLYKWVWRGLKAGNIWYCWVSPGCFNSSGCSMDSLWGLLAENILWSRSSLADESKFFSRISLYFAKLILPSSLTILQGLAPNDPPLQHWAATYTPHHSENLVFMVMWSILVSHKTKTPTWTQRVGLGSGLIFTIVHGLGSGTGFRGHMIISLVHYFIA